MNETIGNQNGMYDEVKEVKDLNRVEGFDPRKYMRIIQEEGGKVTYYLDVAFRKLWFRLKYPEGKVVKKILKLTEQVAIVEAKVYLNRSDAEENFVSNAFAQKYFSAEDSFGSKYVELAETAAVGRALTDAGFGLQFSDRDGETDPQVTEAPFEAGMLFQEEGLPEGNFGNMGSTGDGFDASEWMMMDAQNGNDETEKKAKQNVTEIRKDMPVEQIYSLLTRDSAAAVVIPTKYYHGMTLGQLAIEKPQALEWYVTSYGGPDNLLRAAARFLLDTALKQAG
ncbi:MAG: hypothetical protein ACLRWN_08470 [Eisenbergiella sp.]|uniref:hypothetical protein n=1 Tax=Eisenbergiella sp. TaxID=1924109 RepID=UPI0039A08D6D